MLYGTLAHKNIIKIKISLSTKYIFIIINTRNTDLHRVTKISQHRYLNNILSLILK